MKHKKLVIYYFSGTGNAKNTALWIADEAKNQGYNVDVFNIVKIKDKDISSLPNNTLVGFISPTHGFHYPEIMRKFIKKMPKSKNNSAFIMNTRAGLRIGKIYLPGLSGLLHYWTSVVLMIKGYKIVGLQPVDLPSNWLSIHPAMRKKGINLIYKRIEPKIRAFTRKLLDGKKSYKAFYDILQDMAIAPVSVLYILFGKYFFAKSFIASSDCTMCGLCEKGCPVNAIKQVDGRMFWTYKCESCMKCMSNCPAKAIQTAHGFIIAASVVLTFFLTFIINQAMAFVPSEECQIAENQILRYTIITILFFPLLFAAYSIIHRLMRYRIFERLVVLTSLTNYKFWGRYKAPRQKKSKH